MPIVTERILLPVGLLRAHEVIVQALRDDDWNLDAPVVESLATLKASLWKQPVALRIVLKPRQSGTEVLVLGERPSSSGRWGTRAASSAVRALLSALQIGSESPSKLLVVGSAPAVRASASSNEVHRHLVFLSYRRAHSADIADRIHENLGIRYGDDAIFEDVSTIPQGVDFRDHIEAAVRKSRVALVIIDPEWAEARDAAGRRRLEDPADVVRLEIEEALRHGVPLIPVLVRGAKPLQPSQLPERR
jgi:hypothetical protein